MNKEKNYIFDSVKVPLGVIIILFLVSFVPKTELFGVRLKHTDILSELRLSGDSGNVEADDSFAYGDSQNTTYDKGNFNLDTDAGILPFDDPQNPDPSTLGDSLRGTNYSNRTHNIELPSGLVAIEDFGGATSAMSRFYEALDLAENRTVRIAVLGDSFIEGDILTADLREQLQELYGGHGIGFVPFSSNLAPNRATAKHSYSLWRNISVMTRNTITAETKDRFFVSGLLLQPNEGATSRLEGTKYRKHLRNVSTTRLLFTNEGNTTINVTVNDTIKQSYHPESKSNVQQIVLSGSINSVQIKLSQTTGFYGYGMYMSSNRGIVVDNYTVRGNSGQALYHVNKDICRQITSLIGSYDLVILQYGQNVVSPDQTVYNNYSTTLTEIANYVKGCFGGSSVMIMSVGDRSSRESGELRTMPAVRGMVRAQRAAAERAGVAFWNTFEGMGGENSMVNFVNKNWAAKDYTHIGYPGGKYIATEMVKAIVTGKKIYDFFSHDNVPSAIDGEYIIFKGSEANDSAQSAEVDIADPSPSNANNDSITTAGRTRSNNTPSGGHSITDTTIGRHHAREADSDNSVKQNAETSSPADATSTTPPQTE